MKKQNPILILIGAIVTVGFVLGIFGFIKSLQKSQEPSPSTNGTITISGEIACLPKNTTGPQTLECALGLKADDGNYYALKDITEHDPDYTFQQTDTRVEITGTVTQEEMLGPDGNPYNIEGAITIDSIKKL